MILVPLLIGSGSGGFGWEGFGVIWAMWEDWPGCDGWPMSVSASGAE